MLSSSIYEDAKFNFSQIFSPPGHNRAPCNLVARLVQARPIYVTYVTIPSLVDRVKSEIFRSFEPDQVHLIKLIRCEFFCFYPGTRALIKKRRVIAVSLEGSHPLSRAPSEAALSAVYQKLVDSEPAVCYQSGVQHAAVSSPTVVVVDVSIRRSASIHKLAHYSGALFGRW